MGAPTNNFDLDPELVVESSERRLCAETVLVHRDWLLTVLATRLRSFRDVAEDLFHNLATELAAGKHDLIQVEALEPWLYRLTVNKANDWLRSEQRFRSVKEKLAVVQEQTKSSVEKSLPIDFLLKRERSQQLKIALDSMEVEDAEILNLKYLHDWNYVQLEKHLGLSQHQITHRLRMARQRLKHILLQMQDASHWTPP